MSARRAVQADQNALPPILYRMRAQSAIREAQTAMDCIARATDAPEWQDVDVADHLDAAARLLAKGAP